MKEICTYNQPEPKNKGELKKIKICHWAYLSSKDRTPIRAYKIVWAYDIYGAMERNLIDPDLIFDIGYV